MGLIKAIAGAAVGFMGVGMAGNMAGANLQGLYGMGVPNPAHNPAPMDDSAKMKNTWKCDCGKEGNGGRFCSECGKERPMDKSWICSCGAKNQGKFCSECGEKKPADAPLYKCDVCGFEPEDPHNPPKFCPECGDRFDEKDIK